MSKFLSWFTPADWKRGIALVILWAYAYALVIWPSLFWLTTLLTMWLDLPEGKAVPAPPIVPWEQLTAGTATLAAVGGLEKWGERTVEKGTP